MPTYIYKHPSKDEYIDLIQSINEPHEYKDKNGLKWVRVFTSPQVNTNGTLDVNADSRKFAEYTKNHKGTIGDLWDRSAELSEKRKKIYGEDPVKKSYKEKWSKKRKNKKFIE